MRRFTTSSDLLCPSESMRKILTQFMGNFLKNSEDIWGLRWKISFWTLWTFLSPGNKINPFSSWLEFRKVRTVCFRSIKGKIDMMSPKHFFLLYVSRQEKIALGVKSGFLLFCLRIKYSKIKGFLLEICSRILHDGPFKSYKVE